jgi:hypothetical protein
MQEMIADCLTSSKSLPAIAESRVVALAQRKLGFTPPLLGKASLASRLTFISQASVKYQ